MITELKYLEHLYDLMDKGGLGDDGEIMTAVRRRITEIKINKEREHGK